MVLAGLMMLFGALPGVAGDRASGERVGVDVVDRPLDVTTDQVVERPSEQVRPAAVDRYRCIDVVTDRRCIDDRHPHVNVRHLIQRLIDAGEWEKLFRLLHRLGII